MKVSILMSNEERKKIQIVNNIKDPSDLKAYFAISLECDPEDIEISAKRILEAKLTAKDINKLKKDEIFTKTVFITELVLKYQKRPYKKKEE